MKRFLIIFLLTLVALVSKAQNPYGEFYYLQFFNGGDPAPSINGIIRFNFATGKFEFREDGIWKQLGAGGGTGITDGDKGDVTVSGSGASWFVDNAAITLPKLQTIVTSTILGRTTAGTGIVEQLTPAQVAAMLPIGSTTAKGLAPLSPGGTTAFLRADWTWADPALGAGGGTTETASNLLTKSGSDIRMGGTQTLETVLDLSANTQTGFNILDDASADKYGIIRDADYGMGQGIHYVAGDFVNKTGQYSRLTPQPHSIESYQETATGENVTFRVSADLGTYFIDNRTVKRGIQYGGLGYDTDPLSLITRGTAEQLIAAAVNTGIPDGDKGNITVTNGGATWTIDNDVVTYAKMQNITGLRFFGRSASTTGDPQEITGTQATAMLDVATSTLKGLVPASGGGTGKYLDADFVWKTLPSSGSTYGVFTSTVNGLVPASGGGTGKVLRSDATWADFPTFIRLSYAHPGTGSLAPNQVHGFSITGSGLTVGDFVQVSANPTIGGNGIMWGEVISPTQVAVYIQNISSGSVTWLSRTVYVFVTKR